MSEMHTDWLMIRVPFLNPYADAKSSEQWRRVAARIDRTRRSMSLPRIQRVERLIDDFRRLHITSVCSAITTTSRSALSAERRVGAAFAIHGVHTESANRRVIPDATFQHVVSDAANNGVVAIAAEERIVAILAGNRIVSHATI